MNEELSMRKQENIRMSKMFKGDKDTQKLYSRDMGPKEVVSSATGGTHMRFFYFFLLDSWSEVRTFQ